jgi:hypothetical protein
VHQGTRAGKRPELERGGEGKGKRVHSWLLQVWIQVIIDAATAGSFPRLSRVPLIAPYAASRMENSYLLLFDENTSRKA